MATYSGAPQNWTAGILGGRNPYGRIGSKISNAYGTGMTGGYAQPGMMESLPPWLRAQYASDGGQGEDGRQQWVHQGRGTITDQSGKPIYQIGYDDGDENVIDQNAVWYDDELGLLTDPGNIRQKDRISTADILGGLAFVVGGPMALQALGGAGAGGSWLGEVGMPGWAAEGGAAGGSWLGEVGLPGWAAEGGAAAGGGALSGIPGLEQLPSFIRNNPMKALSILKALGGLGGGGGANSRGFAPNGGGNGMPNFLDLLGIAGQHYNGQQNLDDFRGDIQNMYNAGTAGVTNDDRAGARGLVRGVYDGSISGDEVFNRVPGLRAMSDREADDISRRYSRNGEVMGLNSGSPDSHAMREWVRYNNELTTKAWNSEMDRASRIGGFDFNPAGMAGKAMDAYGHVYGEKAKGDAALWAALNRAFTSGGAPGSSAGENIWKSLLGLFNGTGGGDDDIPQWETPGDEIPSIDDILSMGGAGEGLPY